MAEKAVATRMQMEVAAVQDEVASLKSQLEKVKTQNASMSAAGSGAVGFVDCSPQDLLDRIHGTSVSSARSSRTSSGASMCAVVRSYAEQIQAFPGPACDVLKKLRAVMTFEAPDKQALIRHREQAVWPGGNHKYRKVDKTCKLLGKRKAI